MSLCELWAKLKALVTGRRRLHDLQEEIDTHLAMEIEAADSTNVDLTAVRRRFGNRTLISESAYNAWTFGGLDQFWQDVRYALRIIRRNRAFSAVAVLTLGLGIGANSAMFSLFDAVLLRLLPVRDPQQLHVLHETGPDEAVEAISFPMFQRFRDALRGKAEILTLTKLAPLHTKIGSAAMEPVTGQLVSGEFFPVLGIRPALGRLLTPEDNRSLGQHSVLVISYAYWQRRFGGDLGVLGSTLPLNGAPFTIVGVAERGFFGVSIGESPDVWLPLLMQADVRYAQNAYSSNADTRKPWPPQEGIRWLDAIVRVADPGAMPAVATTLNVLYQQEQERAGRSRNERERRMLLERRLSLEQGAQGFSTIRRRFSTPLRILMTMVGLVLLITCANIANLLLGRAIARRKEIAIRVSIGAGRSRLMRQLLTESIVLALLGGIVGLLIAVLSNEALPRLFSINIHLHLDYRLLAYTAGLSLVTGILFGLAPAFRIARVEPGTALKSAGPPAVSGRRLTLGKTLVIVQVALALLLVTAAGLLARTLRNLLQSDLGFERDHVLTVRIDPRSAGFEGSQLPALYSQIVERVRSLPGVRSATIALSSIAGGGTLSAGINVPGYTPGPRENVSVDENFVDPGYFATVGMSLVQGRDFDARDTEKALKVAVINETMARHYFGLRSPIGRSYGYGSLQFQIVGVVRDARVRGPRAAIRPMAYRPIRQEMEYAQSLEVRTRSDPRAVASDLRKVIAQVAPNLPVQDIATLAERLNRLLAQEWLIAQITTFFGLLALLLSCVGIYGMISYAVARRTAEMGIRMALGARRASVVWLVLREALILILIGLAVGIPLLFAASRLLTGLLFGVSPTDPATLTATALLMLSIAALAAYLPARRASRVDPIAALRQE
jgi:predicted permease